MERIFEAVMHCQPDEPVKVNQLGIKVKTKLILNSADYPSPPVALTGPGSLEVENDKLADLIVEADGNTDKLHERDAQSIKVYNMLDKLLLYVNGIAKGDLVLVDKSGFDSVDQPDPHGAPDTPVIDRIIDAEGIAHAGKIFLVKNKGQRLRYTVQTSLTMNEADFKNVPALESVNRNELVITGLSRGQEIFARVRAEDGSKKSVYSDPVAFLPR